MNISLWFVLPLALISLSCSRSNKWEEACRNIKIDGSVSENQLLEQAGKPKTASVSTHFNQEFKVYAYGSADCNCRFTINSEQKVIALAKNCARW